MKRGLLPFGLIVIVAFALKIGSLIFGFQFLNGNDAIDFYANNLREPLFSGFLTIGGFLFSLKTFIITVMKSEVYDTDAYNKRIQTMKAFDKGIKRYDNLKKLSDTLFYIVLVSMVTATMQFTLGLIKNDVMISVCCLSALYNMYLLVQGTISMKENLDFLYNFNEE